ncbi:MAG TPA: phosphate acyltransferase PlsX [Candidatus Aquicultor sp.]|jgi:glycerol-3-phosphate acyltransferase PlsX
MSNTTIVVDVMGGELGPDEIIKGCISAATITPDANIILLGPEDLLTSKLSTIQHPNNISIEHAPDVIRMDEEPAKAVRQKSAATVVVGSKLIKEGKAHALVSPGNTGAVMAAALLIIGRIKGVSRPALIVRYPMRARDVFVLDVGANAMCKPENLLDFAIMADSYLTSSLNKQNPAIGLLSIGEEESKGNELTKETFQLLKDSSLNFYGNVEGNDVTAGKTDIVVCDGFTGNVVLKLTEGLVKAMFGELKAIMTGSLLGRLGALFLMPGLKTMKKRLDPDETGGSLLLGVNGVCVISHGKSSGRAIHNAIIVAADAVSGGVVAKIQAAMKEKAHINV